MNAKQRQRQRQTDLQPVLLFERCVYILETFSVPLGVAVDCARQRPRMRWLVNPLERIAADVQAALRRARDLQAKAVARARGEDGCDIPIIDGKMMRRCAATEGLRLVGETYRCGGHRKESKE